MTAKELIKALKKLDPDTDLAMSSDPEGNDFYAVAEIDGNGTVWPGARLEIDAEEEYE